MRLRSTSLQAAALGSLIALSAVACGGKSLLDGANGLSGGPGVTSAGGASSNGGAGSRAASGNGSSSGAPGAAGDSAVAGAACSAPPACGGDLVGIWKATSSCLVVSGKLDLSSLGIECPALPLTGYREVMGSWSANGDHTYTDGTTTIGVDSFDVPTECLHLSGVEIRCDSLGPIFSTFGYSSASCARTPQGGCACSGKIEQTGGLGLFTAEPSSYGTFSTSNGLATLDSQKKYAYCASRSTLTWTPIGGGPSVSGSVSFERAAQ